MFFEMNELLVFVLLIAFSWLAIDFGYRLGQRHRVKSDDTERSHIGSLQETCWACWHCCWAFPLPCPWRDSTPAGSWCSRRPMPLAQLLRTDFLSEEQGNEARKLLRTYVDSRLAYVNAKSSEEWLTRAFATAASLQAQLWAIATDATTQDPRSVPAGLFAASLNDVIDVSEERVTAFYSNVPEPILGLLVVVSCGRWAS